MSVSYEHPAAKVREALKAELGVSARQVSVKKSAGGHSVNVTIKDPELDMAAVKKIAKGYQRVSYCEASGEILSGGNIFVFVEWSHDARMERAGRHQAALREAMDKAVAEPGFCMDVVSAPGVSVSADKTRNGFYSVWVGDSFGCQITDDLYGAAYVADAVDLIAGKAVSA